MKRVLLSVIFLLFVSPIANTQEPPKSAPRRNVIIFVADGLRHGSVNATDTPALWSLRTQGVHFENSYSLFPTFTTANASAIATGHRLGDTGDFSNALYVGYQIFDTGNFNHGAGTTIPFIENDEILADLDSHHNGNYLNEVTLLQAARSAKFNTAAIGKLGPAAIQDIGAIAPQGERFPVPPTIIIDDSTAYRPWDATNLQPKSIPMPKPLIDRLLKLGIPLDAPGRNNGFPEDSAYANGNAGDAQRPGTLRPNDVQQQWMTDVTTKAVLPMFAESGDPFVMLFWSRDPDATQHNHGDSLNQIVPGINGPTSKLAIRNADHSLALILQWLDQHPDIKANTDIFITSDHGFATVSRREIERTAKTTKAPSAQHLYYAPSGQLSTNKGDLPIGFLAIDLAYSLQTRLWDPDAPNAPSLRAPYKEVHLSLDEYNKPLERWEYPGHGNGLLGNTVYKSDGSDAMAIVAANGGSDLIYVPGHDANTVQHILAVLLKLDYVGSIFVDDRYGKLPGTLPLSSIDLVGTAVTPRPDIVVAFRSFYLNPGDIMLGVQVSDTNLQEGQGNHGGFGRDCTYNNMAAIGPDFKRHSVDHAPVGNADIVPTVAKILGLQLQSNGKLQGRVLDEALAGSVDPAAAPPMQSLVSAPAPDNSLRTVLFFQEFGGQRYFYSACMTSANSVAFGVCEGK